VVFYNVSRLSRDKYDYFALRAFFQKLGITLRSVTEPLDDSPAGRFIEGVLASAAQFDNDVKAERTRAGMLTALELGRWIHQPPLGYCNGSLWGTEFASRARPSAADSIRVRASSVGGNHTRDTANSHPTGALGAQRQAALSSESHGHTPESDLRRAYRARTMEDFQGWRLGATGEPGTLLACSEPIAPERSCEGAYATASGFPSARVCPLRSLSNAANGQLVARPERQVRLLQLSEVWKSPGKATANGGTVRCASPGSPA
jgi:Resolvase, N terminal domain